MEYVEYVECERFLVQDLVKNNVKFCNVNIKQHIYSYHVEFKKKK